VNSASETVSERKIKEELYSGCSISVIRAAWNYLKNNEYWEYIESGWAYKFPRELSDAGNDWDPFLGRSDIMKFQRFCKVLSINTWLPLKSTPCHHFQGFLEGVCTAG